jgi:hypothetical protein
MNQPYILVPKFRAPDTKLETLNPTSYSIETLYSKTIGPKLQRTMMLKESSLVPYGRQAIKLRPRLKKLNLAA